MRKKLVAGNWKMNGNSRQNAALVEALKAGLPLQGCEVVICPPFPYLQQVGGLLNGTRIGLGAQSLSQYAPGAYTAEVAAEMLLDLGCKYVLVGHSERRALFGERDLEVAAKFERALQAGLIPVLCVGETLEERQAGITNDVVARQLMAVVDRVGVAAFSSAVVAYEPVWAIGTGMTATPAQAQAVHGQIRGAIAALDPEVAQGLRILYGGSVKAQNAEDLFSQADIDGGLIGGAALVADDFLAICRAAA